MQEPHGNTSKETALDDIDSLVSGLLSTPADKGATPPAADDKKDATPASDVTVDDITSDASDDAPTGADNSNEPADEPAGDGADDGEGQDDEGTESADTEPLYTVKIDGKDTTVKLSEALAGYQRQQDYTRKTQEIATQRQALEAEAAKTQQARGQYEAVLGELARRLGPENGERTEEQWNELRNSDAQAYAREYTDFVRRQAQRKTIADEQARINQLKVEENQKKLRDHLAGERVKLVAALPDFGDTEKAPKAIKAIRDFGQTLGFTEMELDQAADSRVLVMADMARKWSEHVKAQAAAKAKLAKAPPITTQPGAKQVATPKGKKAAADKAALQRLEKTGKLEDAVSLILRG